MIRVDGFDLVSVIDVVRAVFTYAWLDDWCRLIVALGAVQTLCVDLSGRSGDDGRDGSWSLDVSSTVSSITYNYVSEVVVVYQGVLKTF